MFTTSGRAAAVACLAMALCGAVPALAQKKYDPGVSDTEILLGMTTPLSGPLSGYSTATKATEAYFKMLNEQGGINGRKVRIIIYDDQFSPPSAVEAVRRLVEQDKVFAVPGVMGSATNSAIQRYLNMKKVPQLLITAGAQQFNDSAKSPWTIPMLHSTVGEGRLIARHIVNTRPEAKIALLMQNDDLGRDLLKGMQQELAKQTKVKFVAQASYEVSDPTVDSQIVQLRASDADVLVFAGTARAVAQGIRKAANIGWTPVRYTNLHSTSMTLTFRPAGADKSKGVYGFAFYKDPSSPRWAKDPEMIAYHEMREKYAPDIGPTNGLGVSGYLTGQLLTYVLKEAGDNLTRDNVRRIASNIPNMRLPMMLPGTHLENSPEDLFATASLQPVQFNGEDLDLVGSALSTK